METFWLKGYEATSVADLVDATGVNRASLYALFGAKHGLLLAALEHYESKYVGMLLAPLEAGGLQSIVEFFENFATVTEDMPERAAHGCLMVNSTIERAAFDEQVDEIVTRYRITIRTALERSVTRAVNCGELSGSPEQLADQLYLMAIGLFVNLRGGVDAPDVARLVSSVVHQFESLKTTVPATTRPLAEDKVD